MSRKISDNPKAPPHPDDWGARTFERTGFSSYRLTVAKANITFDISRLRREREELFGELIVKCDIAGARTTNGMLSAGEFNLSSVQARATRAKHLANRASIEDMDWEGWLHELAFFVIEAERTGQPAEVLTDIPAPVDAGDFELLGVTLPRAHPTILFGDGGSAKSLFGLWAAGQLARQGEIVLYADWEATGGDHRARFDQLFPDNPPPILYVRCERPLVSEIDRLRVLCVDHSVTYVVLDSAAYGCHGAPEAAETALDYFRALRSLNIGALIIAHVTKSDDGDKRPFGSSFWHNSARSTWHAKRSSSDDDGLNLHILMSHRKCNIGRLRSPVVLTVSFRTDVIKFTRGSVVDVPEFTDGLSVSQRIFAALKNQSLTVKELQVELEDEKKNTVIQAVTRGVDRGMFIRLPNEKIGIKH